MPIQLYDPWADKAALLAKLAKLEPYRLGICASDEELEGRADYISALTKLVADHIENLAADAASSATCGNDISADDAKAIIDIGGDIAGSIRKSVMEPV